MFELIVFAGLAFATLIVVGVLISVFSVVGWFLWLPFILLALMLGGFGMLLGAGVLVLPLFPLAAIGALVWWFFHRRPQPASQARVV